MVVGARRSAARGTDPDDIQNYLRSHTTTNAVGHYIGPLSKVVVSRRQCKSCLFSKLRTTPRLAVGNYRQCATASHR